MTKINLKLIKNMNSIKLTDEQLQQEHYKVHKLYSLNKRLKKFQMKPEESLENLQKLHNEIKKELNQRKLLERQRTKKIVLTITPMKLKRVKKEEVDLIDNPGNDKHVERDYVDIHKVREIENLTKNINTYPKISSKIVLKKITKTKVEKDEYIITERPVFTYDWLQKMVVRRGSKWCVVHAHPKKPGSTTDRAPGTIIHCFPTRAQAERMHQAIGISEAREAGHFKTETIIQPFLVPKKVSRKFVKMIHRKEIIKDLR
jgi:hypothetical protein